MHILVNAIMGGENSTHSYYITIKFSSDSWYAATGGVCFMFSGIFNFIKNSLGFGGGISVWFILAAMLSLVYAGLGMDAPESFL